jgi:Zn-dependent oligopeptidase
MQHCSHCWTDHCAAGMYVYIWADVMAADAAEGLCASARRLV